MARRFFGGAPVLHFAKSQMYKPCTLALWVTFNGYDGLLRSVDHDLRVLRDTLQHTPKAEDRQPFTVSPIGRRISGSDGPSEI